MKSSRDLLIIRPNAQGKQEVFGRYSGESLGWMFSRYAKPRHIYEKLDLNLDLIRPFLKRESRFANEK